MKRSLIERRKTTSILTNVWIFYYKVPQHRRIVHLEICLNSIISRRNPMLKENTVNIRVYYLIVDAVEQLTVMLGSKNHWLYVLINQKKKDWNEITKSKCSRTDFFYRKVVHSCILWIISVWNGRGCVKRCWWCHQHGENNGKKGCLTKMFEEERGFFINRMFDLY